MKTEIFDDYEVLDSVNEIKSLTEQYRYKNFSYKDLKKKFPDEIEKLEEALNSYISENNFTFLKTDFSDRGQNSSWKLPYPYEQFNKFDDYQKPVRKFKRGLFFSI